jgi:ParB family chromosome partitioning protein
MQNAKEFTLELKKIDAGENPLRLEGENKGIAELAASIGRIGLINPLVVAPDGERYRLIAGHRRYAACKRAGIKEVTVRITGTNQREICEVALAPKVAVEEEVTAVVEEDKVVAEEAGKKLGEFFSILCVIKSSGYKAQIEGFRIFRQSRMYLTVKFD